MFWACERSAESGSGKARMIVIWAGMEARSQDDVLVDDKVEYFAGRQSRVLRVISSYNDQ